MVVGELERESGYTTLDRFKQFKSVHQLKNLDKYFERIGLQLLENRM